MLLPHIQGDDFSFFLIGNIFFTVLILILSMYSHNSNDLAIFPQNQHVWIFHCFERLLSLILGCTTTRLFIVGIDMVQLTSAEIASAPMPVFWDLILWAHGMMKTYQHPLCQGQWSFPWPSRLRTMHKILCVLASPLSHYLLLRSSPPISSSITVSHWTEEDG